MDRIIWCSNPSRGQRLFSLLKNIWTGLEALIQSTVGVLSLGVKWLGHESDYSPPSFSEVKNDWVYTSFPFICLHGMKRDNFTHYCLNCRDYVALNGMGR